LQITLSIAFQLGFAALRTLASVCSSLRGLSNPVVDSSFIDQPTNYSQI
jgi:hypothetical protein